MTGDGKIRAAIRDNLWPLLSPRARVFLREAAARTSDALSLWMRILIWPMIRPVLLIFPAFFSMLDDKDKARVLRTVLHRRRPRVSRDRENSGKFIDLNVELPWFFKLLSQSERNTILTDLNALGLDSQGAGQEQGPTAGPKDDTEEDTHPFPVEMRMFERLYDPETGLWHASHPKIRLEMFDKRLFPAAASEDSVELEVGHFYYAFTRLLRPLNVLETGVSRGYSTCCIASALKQVATDARIFAVDPDPLPHLWDNTDLERFIRFIPKRSQDSLPDVQDVVFDLLVIDSYHDYETCFWETSNFEKLLRPGGYILMHDTLAFDGLGAVVKQLEQNPRFQTVTFGTPRGKNGPRSCGLTVVRKNRSGDPVLKYETRYKGWKQGDALSPPFLWRVEAGNESCP